MAPLINYKEKGPTIEPWGAPLVWAATVRNSEDYWVTKQDSLKTGLLAAIFLQTKFLC